MARVPRKADTIIEGDNVASLDFFTDTSHEEMLVCVFTITRGNHQRIYVALPDRKYLKLKRVHARPGKVLLQWLYDNRDNYTLTHCQEIHLPKAEP